MKQILAEKIMKWNDVEEKNEVQENADRNPIIRENYGKMRRTRK